MQKLNFLSNPALATGADKSFLDANTSSTTIMWLLRLAPTTFGHLLQRYFEPYSTNP